MEFFDLPYNTIIQRFVAKSLFDSVTNTKQKAMFTNDIAKIMWCNTLSSETTNLPHNEIEEIQIFSIELKEKKEIKSILEIIDKTIPYHIIFIVSFADEVYLSASAKHPSPLNDNKSVIDWTYTSPWFKKTENTYSIKLKKDIDTVFFDFCRQLSPQSNSSIKNIADLTAYNSRVSALSKEIEQLKKKIFSCSQFNKKVELNLKLKELEQELRILKF
ncbi:MAG: hypothetical protein PWQ81_108 [Bacteroidota bacterium]|jgi:hypothetical protein|nr:hypothetical protein [Bacteroidota bacterium]MDN5296117.1 hypothetical protein [Bacteroidota bacterium]